jgi:signal transduction histidine kinase
VRLDVFIELPDRNQVTFRVPAPRPGPPLPRGIFLELGILALMLAIVLFLMARSVTRPLSALAGSAEAMSRGDKLPPLPETGARELKEATHAFNTMHERLERYMKSRASLLAAISHDLRTPLTRLRLRAEKVDDAELRESFKRDVDGMSDMLKATLGFFEGMAGDEASEPVDVMRLLGDICVEFAEMGEDVTLEGSAGRPIDARPNALKRCITNLVSNAVKYGRNAKITVNDGDQLVLRVTDSGPGVPEASLDKVFEPFHRLEDSRHPDTGGTGLGLSIARDIAQAHGGSLVLENRAAGGLVAILTLPRR